MILVLTLPGELHLAATVRKNTVDKHVATIKTHRTEYLQLAAWFLLFVASAIAFIKI